MTTPGCVAWFCAGAHVDCRQRSAADNSRARPCRFTQSRSAAACRAVALSGTVVNGSRRWLNLGVGALSTFRAHEDRACRLMLAWYFPEATRVAIHRSFATSLVAAILIAIPVWLIKRQPDLGTALMIAAHRVSTCSFSRACHGRSSSVWWHCAGAAAAPYGVAASCTTTRSERILTFIDPTSRSTRRRVTTARRRRSRIGSGGDGRQGLAQRHADTS